MIFSAILIAVAVYNTSRSMLSAYFLFIAFYPFLMIIAFDNSNTIDFSFRKLVFSRSRILR